MDKKREAEIRFSLRVLNARKNPVYNTMTVDTDPGDAVRYFTERFGDEPEEVFVDGNLLWVGPVEATR